MVVYVFIEFIYLYIQIQLYANNILSNMVYTSMYQYSTMVRSQLGKTTASVSSYNIIIEALGGPSAGPRFKQILIQIE